MGAVDAIRGDGIYYFTDNYEIAKVIHEDVVVKPNTLLLFRHSDGGIAKSDGIGSVEDVLRFFDTNYASPFLEFSQMSKGIADRVYRGAFKYNIFMYAAEDKKEEIGAWASKIPEKFAGKVSPAVIFDAKSSESRIGQYFSFDDALDLSIAVVDLNAESGGKFIMQESATEKSAFQFIEDVLAGNVEPTLKSEPIPLAQKYQIQGFPTIMIFKKDKLDTPLPYEGPRQANDFASGIKAFSGPASTKLDQADEALLKSKDLDHTKVTVIAFLDNTESEDQKNFEDAVDAIRGDGIYYFTDNYEIAKVIHEDVVVKPNTLLLFRHSDGGIAKSDGIGSVEDVLRFI